MLAWQVWSFPCPIGLWQFFYSKVVKVVDLEKGEMLVQHHFGLAERIDSQLKVWSSFEKPLFKYVDNRLLYSCPGVDLT